MSQRSTKLADTLIDQFREDLRESRPLTLEMLKSRRLVGNAELVAGTLLERES